jgi:hypothetical protein
MLTRGNADLLENRVVRIEYSEAESDKGPRPSPGLICRDEEGGIFGIFKISASAHLKNNIKDILS